MTQTKPELIEIFVTNPALQKHFLISLQSIKRANSPKMIFLAFFCL